MWLENTKYDILNYDIKTFQPANDSMMVLCILFPLKKKKQISCFTSFKVTLIIFLYFNTYFEAGPVFTVSEVLFDRFVWDVWKLFYVDTI